MERDGQNWKYVRNAAHRYNIVNCIYGTMGSSRNIPI